MGRGVIFGLCLLAWACGDDGRVSTAEDPVQGECACRLDTQIDNLAVCISPTTAFAPAHVFSSFVREGAMEPECESWRDPQPAPALPWSKLRISAPCAGTGQLCVAIRGGNSREPLASDCTLATRCAAFEYAGAGAVLELAPLASWVVESSTCAMRYEQEGGYLEFTLESDTLGCGDAASEVRRLPICPAHCQTDMSGEGCDVCGSAQIITSF